MDFGWDGGFDVGDIGLFDGVGNLFSSLQWDTPEALGGSEGFLEGLFGGESTFVDGLEGLFSSFGGCAEYLFEEYYRYRFYSILGGDSSHTFRDWGKIKGETQAKAIGAAADAIRSHSLLLEQLEKHAPEGEALQEYKKLGLNLPDEELLKLVKRSLSGKLHPDRVKDGNAAMSAVNEAIQTLGKEEKTAPYRDLLQRAEKDAGLKGKLEKFFAEVGGKQNDFYERATEWNAERARLQLPFHGRTPEEMGAGERVSNRIYETFREAGQLKQGAMAFSLVAGTSLLAYGLAKWRDHSRQHASSHTEELDKKQAPPTMAL